MDFTIQIYNELLESMMNSGYSFQTFEGFMKNPKEKVIVLRHDVDKLPQNSLRFAQIQHKLGIQGTYYFRCVPESYDENIIKEIASLGHEIGYHYEEMDLCNGNKDEAIELFELNLKKLRKLTSIESICMHGSPRSKHDNKSLWKKNNYSDYQIIGEPYFDVNFNKVTYLTDTGRTWNGSRFSVRDKVNSPFELTIASTQQLIRSIKNKQLTNQIMLTFHPQRWTSQTGAWFKELILQNVKNSIKRILVRRA